MAEKIANSGKATTSLVMGVMSIFCFGFLTGIPAIILGMLALRDIHSNDRQGEGWAIIGMSSGMLGSVVGTHILITLWLPAVQIASGATRRSECKNNLMRIGIDLHNYRTSFGSFPPAYITDDQGRPLNSWRIVLAPYSEGGAAYDLNEPWNGDYNSQFIGDRHSLYACPADPEIDGSETNYIVVSEPGFLFNGDQVVTTADVQDGLSNTIAIVEVKGLNIDWGEPSGISFDEFVSLLSDSDNWSHRVGFNALFADGSVRFLEGNIDPTTLKAMFTIAGGEPINLPEE